MIMITQANSPYDTQKYNSETRHVLPELTQNKDVDKTASLLAEATTYSSSDKGYGASLVTFEHHFRPIEWGAGCGSVAKNAREDWDGYSKEKPESFSHVPDKLWEAMVNSYEDGERIDFATLFDVPKWEVGLHKEPPVLNKLDVDEKTMLSYDYINLIDAKIRFSGYHLPDNTSEEQLIEATETYKEYLKQLHTLRENIAKVLDYPLHSNPDDYRAFNLIYTHGGDQDLKNSYVNQVNAYEQRLNGQVVKETVKEKGLFNEYFPQIREALNENSKEAEIKKKEFTDYLLKANSNLFDDLEISSDISEEWYMNFLADHVSSVIESMGPLGSPDSKWEVPILWEIQQQKNNTKEAS